MTFLSLFSIRNSVLAKYLVAVPLLVVWGCTGNLTAGGFGEAEVAASGDAPDTATEAAGTPSWPSSALLGDVDDDDDDDDDDVDPEGELEMRFYLALIREGGAEVRLGDETELEVRLDLAGREEVPVIRTVIPADRYTGLRVVFTELEVEVNAGVVIGGQPILGEVEIDLEGDELAVVRPIAITVGEDDVVRILLDLNAATWLAVVDPELSVVSASDFAEAFSVVLQ